MVVHEVEQGTEAWHLLRLGVPTASNFGKVFTSTCKVSSSLDDYALELAAEVISGQKSDVFVTDWMTRGIEMEAEAVMAYELIKDTETEVLGFVTNDEQTIGCSPDRMRLEVKCPAPKNHLKYFDSGKCPSNYYPQVQGCIWLCETDSWDFMSYHPAMPPFIVTVYRNDKYIKGLSDNLQVVLEKVEKLKHKIGE